jgi:hypothetical protein
VSHTKVKLKTFFTYFPFSHLSSCVLNHTWMSKIHFSGEVSPFSSSTSLPYFTYQPPARAEVEEWVELYRFCITRIQVAALQEIYSKIICVFLFCLFWQLIISSFDSFSLPQLCQNYNPQIFSLCNTLHSLFTTCGKPICHVGKYFHTSTLLSYNTCNGELTNLIHKTQFSLRGKEVLS